MTMKLPPFFEKYIHFIKFNLVGIVNTIITFFIFMLLVKAFGVFQYVAEPIGYACGLVNSFFMNKIWTFGKKNYFSGRETMKFIIVNLYALGGTLLILYYNQYGLGFDPLVGKGLAYLYSVPVNFIGAKYWVFRESPQT